MSDLIINNENQLTTAMNTIDLYQKQIKDMEAEVERIKALILLMLCRKF